LEKYVISSSFFRIEFGKTIKATGKIKTFPSGRRYLSLLNNEQDNITLFSIQLGKNGTNFAILTDEMNGNVYNYGSSIIANFGNKSIQEIVEEVNHVLGERVIIL